jgi:glucose/arabinose dehydrogenase
MRARIAACAAVSTAVVATMAVAASAATGPAAPKPHGGATATLFATGMDNPTSFAWGDGVMFAGDSGNSQTVPNGGVDIIAHGTSTTVPDGPIFVGGMAWHQGALYLSDAYLTSTGPSFRIERWSGFTGTDFIRRTVLARASDSSQRSVLYTAPAGFQGFNGIAFAPNGRLLVGVDTGLLNGNDHGPASKSPYLYDILSMKPNGKDVKVYATGIRQPWQMAFARGSSAPFVSDLGQDGPKKVLKEGPPDFLLKVHKGDNYGFPACNHTGVPAGSCKGDTKPFKMFTPHFDPMGLAVMGKKLYIGSYLGKTGTGGALYSMPVAGGKLTPVVTGFPVATDALAAHRGYLYVGGSYKGVGAVFRVKP